MSVTFTCKTCEQTIEIFDVAVPASGNVACPQCGDGVERPTSTLNTGDVVNGFEVVEYLGCGNMGSVYLARQTSMNDRLVALKIMSDAFDENDEYAQQFLNEIRVMAKCTHPNIVTALDTGVYNGKRFVAMRYVDGETLEEHIQRKGSVDETTVLNIALKMADALRDAWQQHGVLHRDIKPANIMLSANEEPVLLDLGLSKVYGRNSAANEGLGVGTPHYVSPEQITDPEHAECRSDIYSLGCTLFHALTAHPPFDSDDMNDVLTKHMLSPAPNPKMHVADISEETVDLLNQMMAKAPEHRHASWTDLKAHIKSIQEPRPDGRKSTRRPGKTSRRTATGEVPQLAPCQTNTKTKTSRSTRSHRTSSVQSRTTQYQRSRLQKVEQYLITGIILATVIGVVTVAAVIAYILR